MQEAVRIAQQAGVVVRMVTGDNIATASAIARQCGILTDEGMAMEGPTFRKMTPKAVDEIIPRLQVRCRDYRLGMLMLMLMLMRFFIVSGYGEIKSKR